MHTIKGEPLIRKWAPILSYCPDRSISNILYGFTLHCPEDSPSSTFATFPPTFTKRCGWQARYASTHRAACCLWSTMPKRMQSKGDDIISVGKYHGHFLHEILRIDPAYLTWIAFKFQPRIPKQERFVQIAKIYHSVHLDIQRRKTYQTTGGRFLGKEGEKVENLTLTVLSVRLEDNPYKTQLKGTTPYFYVRQVLKLKDSIGNFVSIRLNARTASRKSCQLPAVEHTYQVGELMEIASARIARTYIIGSTKYTRLTHVKLHIPTG